MAMRAARLHEYGKPLQVDNIPRPTIRAGAVLIRVVGTRISAFSNEVISGKRRYAIPQPFPVTMGPNSLGIVEEVGADVFDIEVGQLVLVDPRIHGSQQPDSKRDDILIGWTALSAEGLRTQKMWKDGAWAEYQLVPASNITIIPNYKESKYSAAQWTTLSYLAISYGGLRRGDFQPGQTVIITGATGDLGAGAVFIALAMGASKIIAVGRNKQKLDKVQELDKKRIIPLVYKESSSDFTVEKLKSFTNGIGADLVVDFIGGTSAVEPLLTCIRSLKYRGKAVFVGNIEASIPLTYSEIMINEIEIRGCFMFPSDSFQQLIRMAQSGLLDLTKVGTRIYSLDQINQAIEDAAKKTGNHFIDWVIVEPTKL
jgi:alcohol dehydrogenase